MDLARPLASGATMALAVANGTARKPALASAPTTRMAGSAPKPSVSEPAA
ncbi:hypothetical protein [Streptomyces sp. SLBN-8D4]